MEEGELVRRTRFKRIAVGVTVVVLTFLAVLRFLDLAARRERVVAAGDARVLNLTHILARYVIEAFAASDATLRQLTVLNVRLGGPGAPDAEWQPPLAAAQAGISSVGSISVMDREGIIRHSTLPGLIGQSRREEFMFRTLRTDTTVRPLISTPFPALFNPVGGFVIPIGRRLVDAKGNFDGAAIATMFPDSLRDLFGTVDVGRDGMISVLHTSGVVLLRVPSSGNTIGGNAANDPLLVAARQRGTGTFRTEATASRPALRNAVELLEPQSLVVAVSLGEREVLANVNRDALISAVVLGAIAVLAAVTLGAMFRQVDRRAAMLAVAERSQHLEALGRLTGGVAHDFNNLLAVILGYASLIRSDPASPTHEEDQEALGEIRAAATRAAVLTSQLLAFARRQPLQPRRTSFTEIVRQMESMLLRAVGEDVTLRLNLGEAGQVKVDPVQLDTAILNLVVNARHAMPKGGLLVIETGRVFLDDHYVRGNPEATRGPYAFVTVADTGTGIAPEVLTRVFEPFFTTKPTGEGTGLGLSMVYGFVRQSGGHARVYSEVGHGTTVKLYFPLVEGEETQEFKVRTDAVPRGAGEVILLTEDDRALRSGASRMLESLGYRVLAARDGPTALALAQREPRIDLLFTDVVLPGSMSGLELAAELKRRRPEVPALFTSGYSLEIIQHRTAVAELHLLAKPYDQDTLARAVKQAMDARE
ncbi:MAG: response regulator [Cytophagaceae bacterium]|nr:response regulator [Gemmatimonadaceae bacterium]